MNKMFALFFIAALHFFASGAGGTHTLLPHNGKREMKHFIPAPRAVQDVLFATNEDLDLYINDELKGTLTKSAHLYIKLPAGNYNYKAKSKTTADEYRDTFSVKDGAPNEVFIDFLYFLDERKLVRESVKNTRTEKTVATTPNKTVATDTATKNTALTKEAERIVINSIISNMATIKGGKYTMGNNNAPAADEVEHPVTISNIAFGKFEITQQQWEVIMGYNPSKNANCAACPVENVSWEEVMKFIRKLNIASNKKFRLPTEAEWEYVAKLGGKAEIDLAGGQEEYIKKTAWYFANSDKKTHPVGQKQPNVAGIYDLMGNVSEWCADWYGSYYYKEDDNQLDPEGPPLGKEKVVRGGSYIAFSGDQFRPSFRDKKNPITKSENIGFRLVMEGN